jgi:hypothetical protein
MRWLAFDPAPKHRYDAFPFASIFPFPSAMSFVAESLAWSRCWLAAELLGVSSTMTIASPSTSSESFVLQLATPKPFP